MTATTTASEKQVTFIQRLIADRQTSEGAEERFAAQLAGGLSKREASIAIDVLLSLPLKPVVHADGGALTAGYYLAEDEVYVLVKAKSSGNLYGKRLVGKPEGGIEWEYTPGVQKRLANASRLTVEQAAETGRLHGACIVCGALLTDPESVQRGIGPVCVKRIG